ncbi:hypothetical protein F5X99DRAFT_407776 [Biscogniauxia marginata]|nr:hypothetical protein F5X99DRAFT_407776 [Biscogniauxia marginata]
MGIASGVNHLVQSVVELIQGIIGTIAHFFQWIFSSIVGLFQWVVSSIIGLFQSFVHFVEGTLGFAIHNFFILGTLAAVVLGYLLYVQPRQAGTATKTKST